MSITDELRDYMLCHPPAHYADFSAMVDRIDKTHERELTEQYASLTVDMEPMTEENMAKGGWMKMPVDADGERIHPGDVMEWINDKNVIRTVSGVGAGVFFTWSKDIDRYTQCNANAYRHRHEPTVKDVLREFENMAREHAWPDYNDLVDAYAEKLREVVEHECD